MAEAVRVLRFGRSTRRGRTIASLLSAGSGLTIAVTIGSGATSHGSLLFVFVCSLVFAVAWLLAGWRSSVLALGVASLLPVVGLLRALDQEAAGDVVAITAFFMLLAAVVGQSLIQRVDRTDGGRARGLVAPRSEASGWQGRIDYIAVLVVGGLATQTWLVGDTLLAFGDFAPLSFLRPDVAAEKLYPLWSTFSEGLGGRNFTVVNAPLVVISDLLQTLGFSGSATQRVIFTGLFLAQGAGMIYLLRSVWPHSTGAARVAGGLFYMFNVLALFSLPGLVQMTAFALMPVLTTLMLKGAETGDRRFLGLFVLASIGLAYVGANPPLVLVVGLGACLVTTIVHRCRGGSFRDVLAFLALALPLSALVNAWWIVPLFLSLGAGGASHIPVTPDQWNWTHVRNSMSNLFTLNTNWAWPQRIYYPYSDAYATPLLQVGVFLPAVFAFSALGVSRRRSARPATWLILVCLLLIFVGKGVHEPFGGVNEFLLTEVPGMWLLREPASKLLPIVVMIFALLISFTVDNAVRSALESRERWRRWSWRAVTVVGLGLPLLAFPILTGEFAWGERPILTDAHVKIPGHWHRAADALEGSGRSGAVLVLPLDDFYAMPYDWGYYGPDSIPVELIESPTIMGGQLTYLSYGDPAIDLRERLQSAVVRWNYAETDRLLDTLGVTHVLVRGDIDHDLLSQLGRSVPSAQMLLPMLDGSPLFEPMGRFGPLALFRVTDERNDVVSAWPVAADAADGAQVGDEVADLDGASVGRAGPPTDISVTLGADGVTGPKDAITTVWEGTSANDRVGSPRYYLRHRSGRFRRLATGRDGDVDLIMPWGRWGVLDLWATTSAVLADPSLDRGSVWGRAGCDSSDRGREAGSGRTVLRLAAAGGREACRSREVELDAAAAYEVSFTYRIRTGAGAMYCVRVSSGARDRCLVRQDLPAERSWSTFTDTFTAAEPVDESHLSLIATPSQSRRTVVEFDDIEVRKLERDRVVAIDWSELGGEGSGSLSRYSVDIETSLPGRYEVSVPDGEAPFVLTLNQTYDPAWDLSTSSGRDLDASHTMANGFANGWVVEDADAGRFIIDFPPERWALYARWASAVTAALVLFWFLPLHRRGKKG